MGAGDIYKGMTEVSGSPEWWAEARRRYAAALHAAAANGMRGWEHHGCDHAYGYCVER